MPESSPWRTCGIHCGQYQDEFDHEEEEVTRLSDTAFDIDGSLDVEELDELLDTRLPVGEYDTVAGFLMDQLGRIPAENEQPQVRFDHFLFTITRVEDRRIERVHVEILPPPIRLKRQERKREKGTRTGTRRKKPNRPSDRQQRRCGEQPRRRFFSSEECCRKMVKMGDFRPFLCYN